MSYERLWTFADFATLLATYSKGINWRCPNQQIMSQHLAVNLKIDIRMNWLKASSS